MVLVDQREDSLKFSCSISEILGGHWGFLTGDLETWRTVSSLILWMALFDPNEDTKKVSCWYLYYKCQEWMYLKNFEGSRLETWRTRSFLVSWTWMILFDPKEDTLKVSCWYIYYKGVRNGCSRGGYFEDVDGSWLEIWMMFFYSKEDVLKVLYSYLY